MTLAIVGALCCSCTSFDEINNNPNDPSEVSPKLILPNICESAFLVVLVECMLTRWWFRQTDIMLNNSMSGTEEVSVLMIVNYFRSPS